MLALIHHEDSYCTCGCGLPRDIAHSRDWNWNVDSSKCYAGAALDQVRREYGKKHKDYEAAHDGRLWFVEPVKRD